MSLTDREKEIALALGIPTDKADAFLSRIREEQEAYGYVSPNDFGLNGYKFILDCATDINHVPLFITPPSSPCDCEELVEALEEAHTQVKELCDCHNHPYPLASFERYDEALANHAKRRKENEKC